MSSKRPGTDKVRRGKSNENIDNTRLSKDEHPETVHTIDALKRKAEKIRKAQLDLTLKKLSSLSDEEKSSLETMTRELIQELLREPIERIEKGSENDKGYTQIVSQLFRLDREGS